MSLFNAKACWNAIRADKRFSTFIFRANSHLFQKCISELPQVLGDLMDAPATPLNIARAASKWWHDSINAFELGEAMCEDPRRGDCTSFYCAVSCSQELIWDMVEGTIETLVEMGDTLIPTDQLEEKMVAALAGKPATASNLLALIQSDIVKDMIVTMSPTQVYEYSEGRMTIGELLNVGPYVIIGPPQSLLEEEQPTDVGIG